MKQFLMELPVGLIAHGKIQPGLFVHNALGVGESEKTGFSVVGSMPLSPKPPNPISLVARWMMVLLLVFPAKATVSGDIAGCFFIPGER